MKWPHYSFSSFQVSQWDLIFGRGWSGVSAMHWPSWFYFRISFLFCCILLNNCWLALSLRCVSPHPSLTHTCRTLKKRRSERAHTWTLVNGAAELKLQLCFHLSYIKVLAKIHELNWGPCCPLVATILPAMIKELDERAADYLTYMLLMITTFFIYNSLLELLT